MSPETEELLLRQMALGAAIDYHKIDVSEPIIDQAEMFLKFLRLPPPETKNEKLLSPGIPVREMA